MTNKITETTDLSALHGRFDAIPGIDNLLPESRRVQLPKILADSEPDTEEGWKNYADSGLPVVIGRLSADNRKKFRPFIPEQFLHDQAPGQVIWPPPKIRYPAAGSVTLTHIRQLAAQLCNRGTWESESKISDKRLPELVDLQPIMEAILTFDIATFGREKSDITYGYSNEFGPISHCWHVDFRALRERTYFVRSAHGTKFIDSRAHKKFPDIFAWYEKSRDNAINFRRGERGRLRKEKMIFKAKNYEIVLVTGKTLHTSEPARPGQYSHPDTSTLLKATMMPPLTPSAG